MTSWYKEAQIKAELEKKAGWQENVSYSLMAAVLMVFLGSGIQNAAQKNNISEQEVATALQNKAIVDKAKEMAKNITPQETSGNTSVGSYNTPSPVIPSDSQENSNKTNPDLISNIDIDTFVKLILAHENLIEGQTPFRYTSKAMRKWNTIHGYEIDNTSNKPYDRRNFIFLKNPQDVPKAVKKQLSNYAFFPARYNLGENPTIEDAIKKFDQENPERKIKYLKEKIPEINLNISLSTLF